MTRAVEPVASVEGGQQVKPWTSDITFPAAVDDHAGPGEEHRRVVTELIVGPYEHGATLADLVAAHHVSVSAILKALVHSGVRLRAGAVSVLPPLLRRELARDVAADSARLRSRAKAAELHGVKVWVVDRLIAQYRATLPQPGVADNPAPAVADATFAACNGARWMTPVQVDAG